jgi:hypothetical protein
MNVKTALLGFALLAPAALYATDASAYAKCDGKEGKDLEKCEKKESKRISKLRSKTTAFVPSSLNSGLADLDAEDANPFNMDDYYTPAYEPLGVEAADKVLGSVNTIDAALTMASYVGKLNKEGKTEEATKLASALLPELLKLKDEVKSIKEGIEQIKADPASLVKDNPMLAPKLVGATASALGQLPGMITELPKAVSAVKPLAKGAAAAGVNAATDAAKGAAGDAAGDVMDGE